MSNRTTRGAESATALQAFEDYYSLGPKRSLSKLAEYYRLMAKASGMAPRGPTRVPTLENWSLRFHWQQQIRERIAVEREQTILAAADAKKKMADRRLKSADLMMSTGLMIFRAAQIDKLDVQRARAMVPVGLALLKTGIETQRNELGESAESWAPPKPLHEMSDDELQEYAERFMNLA